MVKIAVESQNVVFLDQGLEVLTHLSLQALKAIIKPLKFCIAKFFKLIFEIVFEKPKRLAIETGYSVTLSLVFLRTQCHL